MDTFGLPSRPGGFLVGALLDADREGLVGAFVAVRACRTGRIEFLIPAKTRVCHADTWQPLLATTDRANNKTTVVIE